MRHISNFASCFTTCFTTRRVQDIDDLSRPQLPNKFPKERQVGTSLTPARSSIPGIQGNRDQFATFLQERGLAPAFSGFLTHTFRSATANKNDDGAFFLTHHGQHLHCHDGGRVDFFGMDLPISHGFESPTHDTFVGEVHINGEDYFLFRDPTGTHIGTRDGGAVLSVSETSGGNGPVLHGSMQYHRSYPQMVTHPDGTEEPIEIVSIKGGFTLDDGQIHPIPKRALVTSSNGREFRLNGISDTDWHLELFSRIIPNRWNPRGFNTVQFFADWETITEVEHNSIQKALKNSMPSQALYCIAEIFPDGPLSSLSVSFGSAYFGKPDAPFKYHLKQRDNESFELIDTTSKTAVMRVSYYTPLGYNTGNLQVILRYRSIDGTPHICARKYARLDTEIELDGSVLSDAGNRTIFEGDVRYSPSKRESFYVDDDPTARMLPYKSVRGTLIMNGFLSNPMQTQGNAIYTADDGAQYEDTGAVGADGTSKQLNLLLPPK